MIFQVKIPISRVHFSTTDERIIPLSIQKALVAQLDDPLDLDPLLHSTENGWTKEEKVKGG